MIIPRSTNPGLKAQRVFLLGLALMLAAVSSCEVEVDVQPQVQGPLEEGIEDKGMNDPHSIELPILPSSINRDKSVSDQSDSLMSGYEPKHLDKKDRLQEWFDLRNDTLNPICPECPPSGWDIPFLDSLVRIERDTNQVNKEEGS